MKIFKFEMSASGSDDDNNYEDGEEKDDLYDRSTAVQSKNAVCTNIKHNRYFH